MSAASAPGHPCVICGKTPAFCFSGVALCSAHIPQRKEGP